MKKTLCALLCICLTALLFAGCGAGYTAIPTSVISGADYHSDFTNLNCTLTSDWVYKTDSEIEQMMGIGEGTLRDGDNYSKTAYSAAGIYDMVATNTMTGYTVSVLIEKESAVPNGKDMDAAGYIAAKNEAYLADANLGTELLDAETVTLDGREFQAQSYIFRGQEGSPRLIICAEKKDGYFITVLYTAFFDLSTSDLVTFFGA